MARMGHVSTRAALLYLHDTDDRQRAIATPPSATLPARNSGSLIGRPAVTRRKERAREGHADPVG
jgi:hypothetical protein